MQFYKKRDFGTLINDTFLFFRMYGKNYFKNYFLLNGILILLLTGLSYLGYREFFSQFFGGNIYGRNSWLEEYFSENTGLFFLFVVLFILVWLSLAIVSYSMPVFYLKRVSENKIPDVQPDELLSDFRRNIKRIFILIAGLIFIVTPLFFILLMSSYVLVLVLIGIFLLLLLIPTTINIINFLIYDYLQNGLGFFETLSKAVRSQFSYRNPREKSPFWKYWGTTSVLYLMIYIVSTVFTFIPVVIYWAVLYSAPSSAGFEQNPDAGSFGLVLFIIYIISIVVSFILMNIIMVASGLMYYDNRTDLHQQLDFLEIESIGNDEM